MRTIFSICPSSVVSITCCLFSLFFFFFNDTATTEIYTLSLHDALPIWPRPERFRPGPEPGQGRERERRSADRKSTRLNSSHVEISYAVFCLKKKKKIINLYSYKIYNN